MSPFLRQYLDYFAHFTNISVDFCPQMEEHKLQTKTTAQSKEKSFASYEITTTGHVKSARIPLNVFNLDTTWLVVNWALDFKGNNSPEWIRK